MNRLFLDSRTKLGIPAAVIGVAILAISSSACSAPAKSYETPDSLCGKSISPQLLNPLLPPGKKVSVVARHETEGIRRCRVYVDDKEALSASSEWLRKDTSLLDVAAMPFNNVAPGDKITKDGKFIYSENGAIGEVTCLRPPTSSERVFTSIRVSGGKPGAEALKNLVREYAEKLKNSDHCS
ncbi:hypothetical protein AB0M42_13020 [Streptomyces sp. NPDC051784]|uniref:hypothetical protein n=1 Tax=Streptomyces sp. NPDC051784 TaxID=3155805 RepID=UPI003441877B